MLVNVVYHEKLREEVGKPIESFNVDESANVASLLARLSAAYPSIRFSTADISRAGSRINAEALLSEGDIIDISSE